MTTPALITIDQYIATFPLDIQKKLIQMREIIRSVAPQATECIAYQMPTFQINGKNFAHFAGYKYHIGFYPTPNPIAQFEAALSSYKTSKGAAQFPLDQELPEKLIRDMLLFRLAQMTEKA
jgi:uncharacterized protein YdhG (YjbR/CyaY superfamily)